MASSVNNNRAPVVAAPVAAPSASRGVVSTAVTAGLVAGLAGGPATGIVVALAAATVGTVGAGLTGKVASSIKNVPTAVGRAFTCTKTGKAALAVTVAREKVNALAAKGNLIKEIVATRGPADLEIVDAQYKAARDELETAKTKHKEAVAKASAPGCLGRALIRAGLQDTPQNKALNQVEQAQGAVALAEGNLNTRKAAIASVKISTEVAKAAIEPLEQALVKAKEDLMKAKKNLEAVAPAAK